MAVGLLEGEERVSSNKAVFAANLGPGSDAKNKVHLPKAETPLASKSSKQDTTPESVDDQAYIDKELLVLQQAIDQLNTLSHDIQYKLETIDSSSPPPGYWHCDKHDSWGQECTTCWKDIRAKVHKDQQRVSARANRKLDEISTKEQMGRALDNKRNARKLEDVLERYEKFEAER